MGFSTRFDDLHLPVFGKNWLRFFLWGIALVVLGIVAIYASTFATLLSVVLIGFLIFFGGSVLLIDTLSFWWGRWGSFFWHLLAAILYLGVGAVLILNPLEGSISLTLLLGVFYVVIGLTRIFLSSSSQMPQWGWSLVNGLITFTLGVLILASWPASSLFIIGLFVGIDLVFSGLNYMMLALAARRVSKRFS